MTLAIENHWLTGEDYLSRVSAPKGRVIKPEVIVIHYGVTETLDSLVAVQKARGYWAHLSIDGWSGQSERGTEYRITQALPFNVQGSHAGPSKWRDREGVNGFSIGIEIANPGPLVKGKDGKLRTTYSHQSFLEGKKAPEWPEDQAVELRHKFQQAPREWTHWAIYTDQEYDICISVCSLLKKTYPSIVDVVGHDDIAPGRKFDPGPAFPIDHLRQTVFGHG